MVEAEKLVGEVLSDTFRLERLLGEGGMGAVYEAAHRRLDRRFAIKILLESCASEKELLGRFQREARIISGIGHPNIVEVTDFQHLPSGRPYIVMELLVGEDLGARMQRQPRIELSEAASILEQAAAGLQAAHEKGIIHRDLKPQNIFLCREDCRVKVLDFGISKVLNSKSKLTRTRTLLGTPLYMAPEQAEQRHSEVDVQTDVWAMGAILYEMVAGAPPFQADSLPSLLYLVVHKPPPPLAELRPDAPEPLGFVIEKALAKRPTDRYASMLDFASAFVEALEATKQGPELRGASRDPLQPIESCEWTSPALLSGSVARDAGGRDPGWQPADSEAREEVQPEHEIVLPVQPVAPAGTPGEETDLEDAPTTVGWVSGGGGAIPVIPAPPTLPARPESTAEGLGKQAKLTTLSLGSGQVLRWLRQRLGFWPTVLAIAAVVIAGSAGVLYGLLDGDAPAEPEVPAKAAAKQQPRPEERVPVVSPRPDAAPGQDDETGTLRITTRGNGGSIRANVYLDGVLVGQSPKVLEYVNPGPYFVRVERDGFRPKTVQVQMGPGQRRKLDIELERARAPRRRQP